MPDPRTRSLLMLAAAPLLALLHMGVLYMLVTPSCVRQTRLWLLLVEAVAVLLFLPLAVAAWRHWRHAATAAAQARFLAAIVAGLTLLFMLLSLSQGIALWALHPCAS
jgi:hypothetical protein